MLLQCRFQTLLLQQCDNNLATILSSFRRYSQQLILSMDIDLRAMARLTEDSWLN